MSQPKLLEPYKLGPITLPNRFVMAPLTRNRAVAGLVPSPLFPRAVAYSASAIQTATIRLAFGMARTTQQPAERQ